MNLTKKELNWLITCYTGTIQMLKAQTWEVEGVRLKTTRCKLTKAYNRRDALLKLKGMPPAKE